MTHKSFPILFTHDKQNAGQVKHDSVDELNPNPVKQVEQIVGVRQVEHPVEQATQTVP